MGKLYLSAIYLYSQREDPHRGKDITWGYAVYKLKTE